MRWSQRTETRMPRCTRVSRSSEVDRLRLIIAKQEVEIARLKKGYWVEGVGAKKEYVTGSGKNTKSSKN